MEETYTIEDALVQFIYSEMSAQEAVFMADLIQEDPELHQEFDALLLAKTQLPKAQFNPSPSVLHHILQYSTKTTLEAQC
jgi:hypothetical protein